MPTRNGMGHLTGRLTSTRTVVNGVSLHARVSTNPLPGTSPVVILVHGMVISSRYMVPIAERLAPFCRVYAPDLPGFGESAKPARVLAVPELADALAAWMRATGLDRAALLGNSMGCQIIAHLAVRHPGMVERVILVGPTMDPRARTLRQQAARWFLDIPWEPRSLDVLTLRDSLAAGPRRLICTIRYGLEDRIEKQLPHVHVPALVVRGSRDTIVPRRWAEEATRLLPSGGLIQIPGAGHAVNYNAPSELARVVLPFLTARLNDDPPGARGAHDIGQLRGETLGFGA
jgi:2-hydroxy-6-oxonona-2,4-dienedioate hydrolase